MVGKGGESEKEKQENKIKKKRKSWEENSVKNEREERGMEKKRLGK